MGGRPVTLHPADAKVSQGDDVTEELLGACRAGRGRGRPVGPGFPGWWHRVRGRVIMQIRGRHENAARPAARALLPPVDVMAKEMESAVTFGVPGPSICRMPTDGGAALTTAIISRLAAVGVTGALLLATPQTGFAAGIRHPLARHTLSELAPQGASINKEQTWTAHGRLFAIALTKWSPTQPTPWIIVAEHTAAGTWNPLLIAQTQDAFAAQRILVGPQTPAGTAVSASFIVDAATGLVSHVYTLLIDAQQARIVSDLPQVVAMTTLKQVGETVQIDGLNLQATGRLRGRRWVVTHTPLRRLLSSSDHPVGFVMGWMLMGGRRVKKISLVGSTVIHAKVGSTLSFVPLNSQAADHMLGSTPQALPASGISAFVAAPGRPLQFYQAAQILDNTVVLKHPGRYTYGIVPPNDPALSPNGRTAVLTVLASK